jgi:hypothetical protein
MIVVRIVGFIQLLKVRKPIFWAVLMGHEDSIILEGISKNTKGLDKVILRGACSIGCARRSKRPAAGGTPLEQGVLFFD